MSPVGDAVADERWLDGATVAELLPMVRRLAAADETALIRLQARAGVVSGFALAASGALVGRRLATATPFDLDATVLAADLAAWADSDFAATPADAALPVRRDGQWRGALPPTRGWTVLDTVPAAVVLSLVADGVAAHQEAQRRALGARAAQDLLDLPVLTVSARTETGPASTALVTNRSLSALVSMAFLPADGAVAVAVVGRWTRLATAFGSVWSQDAQAGLSML